MKKCIFVFVIYLLFFVLIPKVNAESATILIQGPTSAKAGDTITLTLYLDADYNLPYYGMSEGLIYATGKVLFDIDNVDCLGEELINAYSGPTNSGWMGDKRYLYAVSPQGGLEDITRVGELVNVTFKIKDNVADNIVISFILEPFMTRVKQAKNTDRDKWNEEINFYYGKGYYDLSTVGSTLNITIYNPSSNASSNANSSNKCRV